jgi:hypothetical protein
MPEILKNPDTAEENAKTSVITLGIAALVVLAVAASLWFLFEPLENKKGPAGGGTAGSKMGDAEQEYAKNLRFENIGLSRAENFLHQEVTTLNGELVNAGAQPVQKVLVTAEFSDDLNQVVLRETRGVLGAPPVALAPGERRAFEIAFEHVPSSWNRQQPSLRVALLELPSKK